MGLKVLNKQFYDLQMILESGGKKWNPLRQLFFGGLGWYLILSEQSIISRNDAVVVMR